MPRLSQSHSRSSPPSLARVACSITLLSLAASTAIAQAVNESPTNNNAINPPPSGGSEPVRVVQRQLAAPRIDPSTPGGSIIAVHHRTLQLDSNGINVGDYRESIEVFNGAAGFAIFEGIGTPPDETGAAGPQSAFYGKVFGGDAYQWGEGYSWEPQGLIAQSQFFASEQNTFGGLAVNGAGATANARVAFFAGIIDESAELMINRATPPVNSQKPQPERRGIWASTGTGGSAIALRAIEDDTSRLAPPDPDPTRAFRGVTARRFSRLHPSDYGPLAAFDDSFFGEQRFSRVSNIAMNANGAIAFRGDIQLPTQPGSPILGIWADQLSPGGTPTLHRVFVRHTGPEDTSTGVNPWYDFDHAGSVDPLNLPNLKYRYFDVGAPAMTDGLTPTVAAYAVLNGTPNGQGPSARSFNQVAIVTRKVGIDGSNPNGFMPHIVAIEGERFSIDGSSNLFGEFVISQQRIDGLPGLADMPGNGTNSRLGYKDVDYGTMSFSIFQPRPAINNYEEIAFLGRISRLSDASNTTIPLGVDPLNVGADPDLADNFVLDEGLWSNRGAAGAGDLELIAFEGDPAPVAVNGVVLSNVRFVSTKPDYDPSLRLEDRQTFFRPVINNKGEIAFIGRWVHEPTSGPPVFGQSIFVSRAPGQLECLVSSGDLTTTEFNVPGQTQTVRGVMLDEFCRVPNPDSTNGLLSDSDSYEQVGWTDCGILAFTTRLRRDDTTEADLGWALFIYNTAEPTGLGYDPKGPQLVIKTSTGGQPNDDLFRISALGDFVVSHGEKHHHGIAVGLGEPSGGDAALHPSGRLVYGVNPDAGSALGIVVRAEPAQQTLDWDLDGVLDGCDNCPSTPNPNQMDSNNDGVGDACTGGGSGGDCTNCMLCIEIDCPFGEFLLGLGPDFDQSGLVDDTDVGLMMMAMGVKGGRFDMNKDGFVNNDDLSLLVAEYGKTVTRK